MKAPSLSIALTVPALGLLRALGIGLIAVAPAQAPPVSLFSNFPEGDVWDFAGFEFAVTLAAMSAPIAASLASVLLIAVAIWEMLRKPTPPAVCEERLAKEFRFVHAAALILAMLSRPRWDARLALAGAAASVAAFGCAVRFAPTIYGSDSRLLGGTRFTPPPFRFWRS